MENRQVPFHHSDRVATAAPAATAKESAVTPADLLQRIEFAMEDAIRFLAPHIAVAAFLAGIGGIWAIGKWLKRRRQQQRGRM
jgi:hypothetical protein